MAGEESIGSPVVEIPNTIRDVSCPNVPNILTNKISEVSPIECIEESRQNVDEDTIVTAQSSIVEKTYEEECVEWEAERSLRTSHGFWYVREKPRPRTFTYFPEDFPRPDFHATVVMQFVVNRVVEFVDNGTPMRNFEHRSRTPYSNVRDNRSDEDVIKGLTNHMVDRVVHHIERGRSLEWFSGSRDRKRPFPFRRNRGRSSGGRGSFNGLSPSLSSLFEYTE